MAKATLNRMVPELLLAASVAIAPAVFAQSGSSDPAQAQTQQPAATPAQTQQNQVPQQQPGTTPPTIPSGQTDDKANADKENQPQLPPPAQEPKEVHVKKGSIDDVSAVGTRNIGGRGLGNWYSTESEIKMGKSAADEIEKSTKMITDPVVTEYVNRIGQNIVRNSDCKVPFTIKV
ncbi:MAG TPA: peptidase M48, partial [Pseudacidobacterium sp.]|nr:peptidase M48 [Pseudacidobacterium sp.]